MKKLLNVSPFLLLLFPVLIMMVLAFTVTNVSSQSQEVAMKSTSAANTNKIVNATTAILK